MKPPKIQFDLIEHRKYRNDIDKLCKAYPDFRGIEASPEYLRGVAMILDRGLKVRDSKNFKQLKIPQTDTPIIRWSIKKGKTNIRILFSFILSKNQKIIIAFLHAFPEKDEKDYKLAIQKALVRLKELEEGREEI